jgi:hypothetical protein
MSLNVITLQVSIRSAFISAGADPALSTPLANALAAAIDAHIKSATVQPTLLVAPPTGGPVTGTGTLI